MDQFVRETELLRRVEHEEFLGRVHEIEIGVGRAVMRAFGKKPGDLPTFESLRKMVEENEEDMAPRNWWEEGESVPRDVHNCNQPVSLDS